jgi:integrase
MKHPATQRASKTAKFKRVKDARGHEVRGLWKRGARYYALMRVADASGRSRPVRVPLAATTTAAAVAELQDKLAERRKGTLKVVTHAPKLADAIAAYKQSAEFLGKRDGTRVAENGYLDKWTSKLGAVRVNKITKAQIVAVRDELAPGRHPKTLNKIVQGLINVLKYCEERGHLADLPRPKRLKQPESPRRKLLEDDDFAKLLAACTPDVTKNAALFALYLRFLALTGAREQEALRVRWEDVDFTTGRVHIGSDAQSKNAEPRYMDFTPELESLMREMHATRPPDCSWVFPSPQRGAKDIRAMSMKESLRLVRTEAKLPWVGFHTLRHQFISKCVMAGVDYMTIAAWVGHKDGGVLIGKVYGHLSKDHKRETAKRLTFFQRPDNVVQLPQQAAN